MNTNEALLDREQDRLSWRDRKDLPDDPADFDPEQMRRLGLSGPFKGMGEQGLRDLAWQLALALSPDKPDVAIAAARARMGLRS